MERDEESGDRSVGREGEHEERRKKSEFWFLFFSFSLSWSSPSAAGGQRILSRARATGLYY